MLAAHECWAAFGRLTAYGLERGWADFPHQHAVDAYAVQHPGPPGKPITLWFGLVGLHLAFEHGWTGRRVQVAHWRLAKTSRQGPDMDVAGRGTALTIGYVLDASPGLERDSALLEWAGSVWESVAPLHDAVAAALPSLHRL